MSTCTHCGREIPIREAADYPEGWIEKHPEISGMCWECFLAWQEEHQRKEEGRTQEHGTRKT